MRMKIFLLSLIMALSACQGSTELPGLYSNEGFGLSFSYDPALFSQLNEETFDHGVRITLEGDGFDFIALARDHLPMMDVPTEGYLKLVPDELYDFQQGGLTPVDLPDFDDIDDTYDLVLEDLTVGTLENDMIDPGKYYSFALSFDSFQTSQAFSDSGYALFAQILDSLEFTWQGTLVEEVQLPPYCGTFAFTVVPLFRVYGESIRVAVLCPREMGEDFLKKGQSYQFTVSPAEQFTVHEEEFSNTRVPFTPIEQLYWLQSIYPTFPLLNLFL